MRGKRWWAVVVVGTAVGHCAVQAAEAQPRGDAASIEEAKRLDDEVQALCEAGKYDAAIPLAERSLTMMESAWGPDHPHVATSLNNLAEIYRAKGEYDRAEALHQRALAIRENTLAPGHPDIASSLDNLAVVYEEKGDYDRAEALGLRALAIREKALGAGHSDVARSLSNLALVYEDKGDYDRAEPLYVRSLAIREANLGPDHLDVARSLDNLAALYRTRGEYGRAEPLCLRALAVREAALGRDHPLVATSLGNLAGLYSAEGDYDRAMALHRRALGIREKALGPDHPDVAVSLNNVATMHVRKEEYDQAEPLFRRAIAIKEKALGPDHPAVATTLDNLAALHVQRGDDGHAEPLLLRAVAIDERAAGPDHPKTARSLNNLAVFYLRRGEYGRAEPLFLRVIAIDERALGPDHPETADSLINLATLRWTTGRMAEAVVALTRAEDGAEKTLERLVATGSEAQKRAYLAMVAGDLGTTITLGLHARDRRASHLALTTLLRRKGRGLDAMAGSRRALRSRLGPAEQKLFDEHATALARYATLSLRGPGKAPDNVYRQMLADLDEQIQQREAAISARSAAFRAAHQPITTEAIQAAFPSDASLVEWTVFKPFNPAAHTKRETWGPPRYAAAVLPKHGDPVWLDLGDASSIDADIQALRDALRRPANTQASTLARALEARVMAPVRALLGDTRRVFLSPDGALNLIPFAALIGDDGHPLIERYAFTYLTSGRDLLRLSAPAPARDAPLVLAGPDFDTGAPPGAGRFQPMLHADEDAAAIARLFPGASVRLHDHATKASLEAAHGPRLLHIGTHGFFEPIACSPAPQKAAIDNPWLRSGIALAGANACASGHDGGLLTALEASGLDLYGTRLAVLSACETGVGDVKAGDGVYGLRRALVLAGAETQVMSLWSVDDDATSALMRAYYERLARGEGRSEAMRQVQLAMLHGERKHPYYWASFIVSGDDRTLDGGAAVPDLRVHPGGACACRLGGKTPAGSGTWLGVAAAIGVGIARRRRRGA